MKKIFNNRNLIILLTGLFMVSLLGSCQSRCQRKSGKFVKKLNKL
jgi:hypothetical protein